MLQCELIFIKKVCETAGGQTKPSADGESSGRKASGGGPCAPNSHCGEKANVFTLSAEGGYFLL